MASMLRRPRNTVSAARCATLRTFRARAALRRHAAKRNGPGMPYFTVYSVPYSIRALVAMAAGKRARHL